MTNEEKIQRKQETLAYIEQAKSLYGEDAFTFYKQDITPFTLYIRVKCNKAGHVFRIEPQELLNGKGCPKCYEKEEIRGFVRTEVRKVLREFLMDGTIKGEFEDSIKSQVQECRAELALIKGKQIAEKSVTEDFLERLPKEIKNKYDFSHINIKTLRDPIVLSCSKHGSFSILACSVLRKGSGCPKCAKNKKKTTSDFVFECKEKYGDKYDYSLIDYKDNRTMVDVVCKIHGVFSRTPRNFLLGYGCPECDKLSKANIEDTKSFIKEATLRHNGKYDYSKAKFIGLDSKIEIICPTHGSFIQKATNHLKGNGCPKCKGGTHDDTIRIKKFIKNAKVYYRDLYDYSLVNYVNERTPISVVCKKHGVFQRLPYEFLRGAGCPDCSLSLAKGQYKNQKARETFVYDMFKLYGDSLDFSKADYVDRDTIVEVICPVHGSFMKKPSALKQGCGCPACTGSSGEKAVTVALKELGFSFISQYTLPDFVPNNGVNRIRVDFFLPNNNAIIEFNGIQHEEYVPYFHRNGIEDLKLQKRRDLELKVYCANKGINLIIISWKKRDKIQRILSTRLGNI